MAAAKVKPAPGLGRIMLKQRIITAVVLVSALLASVLFLPLLQLSTVFGVAVLIAAWEWSRLAGFQNLYARIGYVVLIAVLLIASYIYCGFNSRVDVLNLKPILGLACLWWSIALLWIKGFPVSAGLWATVPMRCLMGVLVLVPAWLSLILLFSYSDGKSLLLFLVMIVAAEDIGAFFVGRAWGRRKLALAVSPGKTWEGFYGGMLSSLFFGLVAWYIADWQGLSLLALMAIIAFTALAAVVGDLLESMMKRHSQIKDSGNLLPGHGGFMDRIDSLTAAAPVFTLGLILSGWQL